MSLVKMLEDTVSKYPHHTVFIFKGRKISYKKFLKDVTRLSSHLISLGLKPQDKVGIIFKNSPEFVIGYFAVLKAGGIVVPINNLLQVEEIKYILEDSRAVMIISESSYQDKIAGLKLRLDHLEKLIMVDEVSSDFYFFPQFKETLPVQWPVLDIEEVAVIIYTSGTTGYPKGAMLTHHNLLANVSACSQAIMIINRDSFLCVLPMFHSFSFTVSVLIPIFCGGKFIIFNKMWPLGDIIKGIIRYRISILVGIPSLFQILGELKLPWFLRLPILSFLNPVRLAISGADKLSINAVKNFNKKFKFPLLEGYGLTEASPVVSFNPGNKNNKVGSVGLALPGVQVKVIDDNGKETPANEAGELLIKGPSVMKGYWNRPEETARVLRDGWLYSGDITKIDDEGYIYIIDRKKDLIIHHGLNIYPREIEEVLYRIPQISETAVIGEKEEKRGEIPVAVVVLKPDKKITEKEIMSFMRQQVAPYKIPRKIIFKDSLPKTPTGKIAKKILRDELNNNRN